ncbi:hypothetical protein CEE45_11675 [Candidatus Heimdallarchaeota archaeon B3_Heim]|nr:MAG: hypothetical protein CEE45_11675 [Candidatus Heimdallarchaeota archaeon B3_Heim]
MATLQNSIQDFFTMLMDDLGLLFSDPISFFDTYFFSAPGYNLYNTITYTTIGILAILIVGKIIINLNKWGVRRWGEDSFTPVQMDNEFFIAILPYIFIGSSLRALQDVATDGKILSPYEFFADRVFVTPGVYIVTILLTIILGIASIIISQEYLQDRKHVSNWRFTFAAIGIVLELVLILPFIPLLVEDQSNMFGGFAIVLTTGLFAVLFHYSADWFSQKFFSDVPIRREEKFAMITQMFDATNTVIAIEFFMYEEKHYLPALLFQSPVGSWSFLFIKFGVVLFFLWALRGFENRNLERWLLWVVFLLGLATGTRDFLRLITNT